MSQSHLWTNSIKNIKPKPRKNQTEQNNQKPKQTKNPYRTKQPKPKNPKQKKNKNQKPQKTKKQKPQKTQKTKTQNKPKQKTKTLRSSPLWDTNETRPPPKSTYPSRCDPPRPNVPGGAEGESSGENSEFLFWEVLVDVVISVFFLRVFCFLKVFESSFEFFLRVFVSFFESWLLFFLFLLFSWGGWVVWLLFLLVLKHVKRKNCKSEG